MVLISEIQDFEGVYTCTEMDRMDAIMDTIRKARLHRLVVVDAKGRLKGVVSLGDILRFLLLDSEDDENQHMAVEGDSKQDIVHDDSLTVDPESYQ